MLKLYGSEAVVGAGWWGQSEIIHSSKSRKNLALCKIIDTLKYFTNRFHNGLIISSIEIFL